MTKSTRLLQLIGAGALGLLLAACSSGPKMEDSARPVIATAGSEIEAIARLLDRGDIKDARKRLNNALQNDPMNPSLLVLEQGLVGDARTDLGPASYPYTVVAGDTMAGLAQRLLGNRLKSYQLARYNGIANPATLTPGQIIQIPGQVVRASSEKRGAANVPERPKGALVASPASPPRPVPSPAATPPVQAADVVGAKRTRTAGLAALNRGDFGNALALLQRAAVLDPGNEVIERDLARARRIAATVRSRR